MTAEHRLTIPGELEQVPGACSWVVQIVADMGLDDRDANHCELAVDEAITNIIEHAYGANGADKSIDIIVREDQRGFSITIVDEGPPFDPLRNSDPDPMTVLDDRPEGGGGWGIFFIKKVMDGVDYEYTANRNHLRMLKHRK